MTEIEVKLTITEEGYQKFLDLFNGNYERNELWNIFLNTKDGKLSSSRKVLRLRRITTKEVKKYVVTLKGQGFMVNGIANRPEIETDIPNEIAESIIKSPQKLFHSLPEIIKEQIKECENSDFYIYGDFHDVRNVVSYQGLTVEADEMILPNDKKVFELEIENENPIQAKETISKFLNENNIRYIDSPMGKFSRLSRLPEDQRFSNEMKNQTLPKNE